jgi:hypothetical protein
VREVTADVLEADNVFVSSGLTLCFPHSVARSVVGRGSFCQLLTNAAWSA